MTDAKHNKRFWDKVDVRGIEDCWEWQGYCGGRTVQYGYYRFNGKNQTTHRLAYKLTFGEIPEGKCVCHACDNGKCCNPNHLWLGTIADNNKDMNRKGRDRVPKTFGHRPHVVGARNPNAKLTEVDIEAVLKDHRSSRIIAKIYGVNATTIQRIKNRKDAAGVKYAD